jgi:predicted esterase
MMCRDSIARYLLLLAAWLAPSIATADDMRTAPAGLQRDLVFSDYSPLSASTELLRRLFTPLTALRVNRARTQQAVSEQSVDLGKEKFAAYIPAGKPSRGYALLVFVPPWNNATVPPRWISAVDSHDMIFVTAANSGNDANVLDRREPLALLAAYNIMKRYPVDAERVYVAGFSGGSRVAMRLALGYPDLFRGALLSAGSDPIGDAQIPLPPRDLFQQFQESTRLVYLTGKDDASHLEMDVHSRTSMRDWCVFNMDTETAPWTAHDLADAATFNRALGRLEKPAPRDAEKLSTCPVHVGGEMNAQLQQAQDLSTQGKTDDARRLLEKIDAHYGGLAAPRSVALAEKIGSR